MAAAQAYAEPQPLTGARLIAAALLLGLANFMVVLDTTIANVSVPHIAGALAVSPSQGTWVITSYSVAEAITVPLTGWLVQRFGGVKVFAAAMLGFSLFSLACGMAPTFGMLVAFRVMQGLCGGPIMPTSHAASTSPQSASQSRSPSGPPRRGRCRPTRRWRCIPISSTRWCARPRAC